MEHAARLGWIAGTGFVALVRVKEPLVLVFERTGEEEEKGTQDPLMGKQFSYVQFPQRFNGINRHDRYANRNTVFFDINMKGLDGVQGTIYVEEASHQALQLFAEVVLLQMLLLWKARKKKKKKTANEPKVSPLKRISKKGDSDALASEVIKVGVERRRCT